MRDPERARAVTIGRGGLGLVRDSGEVYRHVFVVGGVTGIYSL